MNGKLAKVIRKQCKYYDLPKGMYRKVKRLKKAYNLNITQTLGLIDNAANMYYKRMEEVTKKMEEIEKELNNGSDSGRTESTGDDNTNSNR